MSSHTHAIRFQTARRTGWVLLAFLSWCAALAAEPALPAPKPTPARRADLEAAFTKPAPTSIADLQAMEQRVKDLVPRLSPAVVAVEIDGSSGSGVIISEDGLVLTAGHVVGETNRSVRFTFADGKTARGKTLGLDEDTDTGLMRITDPGHWPHVPVGELAQVHLGDWVLALGHPGGFDAHRSLVVRLGRIIRMAPGVLQTDCTISMGDSGGPLFDMHGRVIGVHSFINPSLEGNFHVPISEFYGSWAQMTQPPVSAEHPALAKVGVSLGSAEGCRLETVAENSPASRAGLKAGDLVLKVEGRDIKAAATFERWLDEAAPGDTLQLEVRRGEKLLSLAVKVGGASQPNSKR